jgi:predicted dehydrogenase
MSDYMNFNRRALLKSAAAIAASTTLPKWFVEETHANAPEKSAGQRSRIALIGCGGQGRGDAKKASRFGDVVMVCDVDNERIAEAKKLWPEATTKKDFRHVTESRDVDVVICGTVDHWHTLISIAAMRAGKDIYCEKPLTLTIDEGKHLVKVSQETGRILQTGSQQRSDARFRLACELVRNARIGKLKQIDVFLPMGRREGPFQSKSVPAGFDWDMWLGSTPKLDYVPERTHVTFRYWWEYSGGTMTDWGAHHNDIALWGLGLERSGPVSIHGKPSIEMITGGFTAASEYEITYKYANGVVHNCRSTPANGWNGSVLDPKGQQNGVKFIGTDGWIWVNRKEIVASDPELLVEPLPTSAERLLVSNDHMGNFFDCVQARKQPICNAEIGHRSVSVCHLGVIAMRLGRELAWDPGAETFVNDAEANHWLAREMRSPWSYESV